MGNSHFFLCVPVHNLSSIVQGCDYHIYLSEESLSQGFFCLFVFLSWFLLPPNGAQDKNQEFMRLDGKNIYGSLISKWETAITLTINVGSKPWKYGSTCYFDTNNNHRLFQHHITIAGIWDYQLCLSLFWKSDGYQKYLKIVVILQNTLFFYRYTLKHFGDYISI